METKIYLNACHGGTENENGLSVAKKLSAKIVNGSPVEALKNDYVDYLGHFDYEISTQIKSPFDKPIRIYSNKYNVPLFFRITRIIIYFQEVIWVQGYGLK